MSARRENLRELPEDLERVKRRIDDAVAELSEMKRHIPAAAGPDVPLPSCEDEQADLLYSCISLELALEDVKKWTARITQTGHHARAAGDRMTG